MERGEDGDGEVGGGGGRKGRREKDRETLEGRGRKDYNKKKIGEKNKAATLLQFTAELPLPLMSGRIARQELGW